MHKHMSVCCSAPIPQEAAALPDWDKISFEPKPRQSMADLLPHATDEAVSLVMAMLTWNPATRITASAALEHGFLARALEQSECALEARICSENLVALLALKTAADTAAAAESAPQHSSRPAQHDREHLLTSSSEGANVFDAEDDTDDSDAL